VSAATGAPAASVAAPALDEHFRGLAPGASQAEVARMMRGYLAATRAHLAALHEAGASGVHVDETHSDLMDRLVRRLFEYAEEGYLAAGGDELATVCVVAVGGYARREMNICSDVDLLFLYQDELGPHVRAVAERVQMWLWDANLAVGAATRTIAETLALAQQDATVRTGILAPRFLAGSGVLFNRFLNAMRAELFSDPLGFIEEQLRAQEARHHRYGDSLYLLQPNVKEGAGGLRDYHVACWVMQAAQPAGRGRDDFLHLGLLTESEYLEVEAALDFLWRVRNALHLLAGRKSDQMSFEAQERIAENLGYGTARADDDELPVERFMSDYYRHARAIRSHSSLVIDQCLARVRPPAPRRVTPAGPFRVADGQLEIPHGRQLREDPVQLLLAFAVAQEHDVPLTRKALRLVRENLHLVDENFRRRPDTRAAFLRILEGEKRVMRTLVAMNEVGLLARYLPEWDHIVCRWQHVMYHTYTVDVHSIFLVEELRRLWKGRYEKAFPEVTGLMRSVDDRVVLFLGCLLHDIGKGFGGEHSEKGATRARACAERLGLEPERVERVVFLVRHHLLMSHLAQRRDVSDPKLVLEFARTVGDRPNLRNLYLTTFADIRASSAKAWSDWKGALLRELFERSSEVLELGADEQSRALELIEQRVASRRSAASAELRGLGVADSKIEAFFDEMPRRYFTAHSPRQIARHAMVVLGLGAGRLSNTAVRELRAGSSEFIVCTKDVHGLFANVAGTLTAHGFDIQGAHVYSMRSGLALEIYRVSTPAGGDEERREAWRGFEDSLRRVLVGELDVGALLARRRLPLGAPRPPARHPASVDVSNDESDFYTIVDVTANDRLGLLHALTRTIAEHGHEIFISKVGTVLDQVADSFYVRNAEGRKLDDSQCERLREALLRAAQPAGDDARG
jgi:[protein-PII] uridylyltransferase